MIKFSVLIPTRSRPKEFEATVDSLFTLALNPREVEVIYRIDKDDPSIFNYHIQPNVFRITGERFGGYRDNWRFIEECASASHGKYLIQMVDTAEMLTPEWDRIYEETIQGNEIAVVASHIVDDSNRALYCWSFPLVTRRLYELTGKFCLGNNPSVDRCWEAFAEEMDCGIMAPVRISHREKRNTQYEDLVAKESQGFYSELQSNWDKRQAEFRDIAKLASERVNSQL